MLTRSEINRKHYLTSDKRRKDIRQNQKRYRQRNRDFVTSYLRNNPCIDCGFTDIRALDFDHVRGKKVKLICDMVRNAFALDKLKAEMAKCDVRCANCHRIKTREREEFLLL